MTRPVATVIIVNYEGRGKLGRCLDALADQDLDAFEVIVVDNASPDGSWDEAVDRPGVALVRNERNRGFGAACNQGAALSHAPYLVFLNNDSLAEAGCLAALTVAANDAPQAGAVQAVVLSDAGTVNTAGNRLHYLGFSWAPQGGWPPPLGAPVYEAPCGSGAALLVPRARFEAVGGFWEAMFLYCEDTDLSWRLRLRGWPVLVCPAARTVHAYEFGRTLTKHYHLERNRLLMLMANYESRSLLRLAPALVATELGLVAISATQGWLGLKLRAIGAVARSGRVIRAQRRRVQASRTVEDAEIARVMDRRLGKEFGPPGRLIGGVLSGYARLALRWRGAW
jgi:GT2 family glycosyltransferase